MHSFLFVCESMILFSGRKSRVKWIEVCVDCFWRNSRDFTRKEILLSTAESNTLEHEMTDGCLRIQGTNVQSW